jgi:hypothetical protein
MKSWAVDSCHVTVVARFWIALELFTNARRSSKADTMSTLRNASSLGISVTPDLRQHVFAKHCEIRILTCWN